MTGPMRVGPHRQRASSRSSGSARGRLATDAQLDTEATYRIRIVYTGDRFDTRIRLMAEGVEVHPWLKKREPIQPVEFDVPRAATADGTLDLTWSQEPGRGGNGRGCQVAEVWLIRARNP